MHQVLLLLLHLAFSVLLHNSLLLLLHKPLLPFFTSSCSTNSNFWLHKSSCFTNTAAFLTGLSSSFPACFSPTSYASPIPASLVWQAPSLGFTNSSPFASPTPAFFASPISAPSVSPFFFCSDRTSFYFSCFAFSRFLCFTNPQSLVLLLD